MDLGWAKKPFRTKFRHISYNDETWHKYTLPKEDSNKYESRDTHLELC